MNKKILTISLLSVFAISACTTNPYTGEREAAKTGIGASIGAVVGAGLGLIIDKKHPGKAAAIGAASGAAIGGGVGFYLDEQAAKLRAVLEGTGVSVTKYSDRIVLNVPNSLTFATNSSVLNSFGVETLRSVSDVLKQYNKTAAHIVGYTDSTGTNAINQKLSEERAVSVSNSLASSGISRQRLLTYGAGESHPIASNATEQGRAQNRRVEITLVPM